MAKLKTELKIDTVSLTTLIPDSANARKHNERNLEEIARSLREFGQHAPLVVQRSSNRILVGNGRYEAMRRLGWGEALVIYVDDDDVKATRRALADNRTAELAEWDDNVLAKLVTALGDDVPGWTADELVSIMQDVALNLDDDADQRDDTSGDDQGQSCHCPKCGFKFVI